MHWPEAELLEGSEIRVLIWAGMLLCTDTQVSDSGQSRVFDVQLYLDQNHGNRLLCHLHFWERLLFFFLDKGLVCLTLRYGVCLEGGRLSPGSLSLTQVCHNAACSLFCVNTIKVQWRVVCRYLKAANCS